MSVYALFKRYRLFLVLLFCSVSAFSQNEFPLQEGTVIVPVDENRAKELFMTEDEYTAVLSRFDLMSKCRSSSDTVTVQDYLKTSARSVKSWSDEEIAELKKITESVSKKISALGLKLNMPERIEIIKSDMSNEGGAEGYTRQNYIVLPAGYISENTFIHELFHVLSRYDKQMSEKVYNTIGFKKCNEVPYPKGLKDLRISNPDAPFNNFYIPVKYSGEPYDIMLILYSENEYSGGSFFGYLKVGLMAVDGADNNKQPVFKDGKLLLLKLNKVTDFYEQIGKNTNYIFHAEELSADHFVMLLNQQKGLPNPELIEAMKKVMTGN